jgi:hypothetical protein
MIPNETPKVERYEDFLPFHDWLMQHLGGRQRYIIYRINMTNSPHPRGDLVQNNWMVTNCPTEIIRWEKAIYRVLEQALQNFQPTRYIFLQHRIGHPLCVSRVWLSLLENSSNTWRPAEFEGSIRRWERAIETMLDMLDRAPRGRGTAPSFMLEEHNWSMWPLFTLSSQACPQPTSRGSSRGGTWYATHTPQRCS